MLGFGESKKIVRLTLLIIDGLIFNHKRSSCAQKVIPWLQWNRLLISILLFKYEKWLMHLKL